MPPVRGPGASQEVYEHPWGAKPNAFAKLFLPGTVRDLLGDDCVAYGDHLVDQASMQTFALGRQFPLAGGFAPPGGQIPFTVFPRQALLAALFDPPTLIIVGRIVVPALSVHLALEPSYRLGIKGQLGAKHLQARGTLAGNNGNRRGA
jgi:hypothetical protein